MWPKNKSSETVLLYKVAFIIDGTLAALHLQNTCGELCPVPILEWRLNASEHLLFLALTTELLWKMWHICKRFLLWQVLCLAILWGHYFLKTDNPGGKLGLSSQSHCVMNRNPGVKRKIWMLWILPGFLLCLGHNASICSLFCSQQNISTPLNK